MVGVSWSLLAMLLTTLPVLRNPLLNIIRQMFTNIHVSNKVYNQQLVNSLPNFLTYMNLMLAILQ